MKTTTSMLAVGAFAAACLLTACSPDNGKTAGQNLDAAISTAKVKGAELQQEAKVKGAELQQDAKVGLAEAKVKGAELKQDAKESLAEAKVATANATQAAKEKMSSAQADK